MDKQWRTGSKQFIDFTVTMTDPAGEMTLGDVEAVPFEVLVQQGVSTPELDDPEWTAPSVPKDVVAAGDSFVVSILHLYQALTPGLHGVFVKFGPTPEEPVYLAAQFVVL